MQFISSFKIFGLFGTKDVCIDFEGNTKVLVGENGIGKTQVLNIFFHILNKDFLKLMEFDFERVEIQYNDKTIKFTKEEIKKLILESYEHPLINDIIATIGVAAFEHLYKDIAYNKRTMPRRMLIERLNNSPSYAGIKYMFPPDIVIDIIEDYDVLEGKKRFKKSVQNSKIYSKGIEELVNNRSLLYFPTYRRVEEDLHYLGYDNKNKSYGRNEENLIHFGMDDVKKRFRTVELKIDNLLKEGFAKISSEILSKLVIGFGNPDKEVLNRIEEKDIDIILARIGTEMPESDKLSIRKIVLEKKVAGIPDSQLYFLEKLIDIYDKQKNTENVINYFKDICNKYLEGKKVVYDESKIKLFMQCDDSNEDLSLNNLSSGEKQVISMFSQVYLDTDPNRKFIVLFDEPELSLSMIWQRQLLPHILQSGKCDFLLAVTHSPFIFDNELDEFAVGLSEYITPAKHNLK